MVNFRRNLLATLPLLSLASALAAQLQDSVRQVPESSLRQALEQVLAPKYRDGVFEDHEDAIEAVHNADPALAARVVDLAEKLDMPKKRQDASNGTVVIVTTSVPVVTDSSVVTVSLTTQTTPADVPVSTSSPAVSSPSTPPVVTTSSPAASPSTPVSTPVVIETTNANTSPAGNASPSSNASPTANSSPDANTSPNGNASPTPAPATSTAQPAASSTPPAPASSVSVVVPITTTNAQGSTVTTSTTIPSVIQSPVGTSSANNVITSAPAASGSVSMLTTTDEYGDTVVLSSATPGAVITTTDAKGRTIVTTITPGGGAARSLVLKTTLLPNGQQSTITSYAGVGETDATTLATSTPANAAATSSRSVNPSLQSGMAAPTRLSAEIAALVGGAMGLAAIL